MMRLALALSFALCLAMQAAHAATGQAVSDLHYPGGTERVLLIAADRPKATVILFPGGDGVIGLASDGTIGEGTNFLVRSRRHWSGFGYSVIIPDAPPGGLMGQRQTSRYAAAVTALVNYARQTSPAPVWLIGTSQGTNAVANAAARLNHGEIAGIILTSSVTVAGKKANEKETVFDADLAAVSVPVLVVAHADDGCKLSPPGNAEPLRAAFKASPDAQSLTMSGGKPSAAGPCDAEAPHGFYGVEVDTIRRMAAFIAAH